MNNKSKLSDLLEITPGSVVAVVGCGGKTSLIECLVYENRDKKVLVTPTTKIFLMNTAGVMLCDTLKSSIEHEPQVGVQCLGQFNERSGKLDALPEQVLAELVPRYDIVLMEADGSRRLPCKGWLDDEPVIPRFTTHTTGVVTMDALGKAATSDVVHNLQKFLSLTGLRKGDIINKQVIEDMVCLPGGMFKGSIGYRYLLVNQVEDDKTTQIAESFLREIKKKYHDGFKCLIFGSVQQNVWHEM